MTQRHPILNDRIMMITTVTIDRAPFFANPLYAKKAVECLYGTKKLHPFFLYAFVIMPDHCHILLKVHSPNTVSHLMNSYKSYLRFDLGIPQLWQRRYHIRIAHDSYRLRNYIHQNPVKAGLCTIPKQYSWSSANEQWPVSPLGYNMNKH